MNSLSPIYINNIFISLCNQQVLGGQQVFSERTKSFLHKTFMFDFNN